MTKYNLIRFIVLLFLVIAQSCGKKVSVSTDTIELETIGPGTSTDITDTKDTIPPENPDKVSPEVSPEVSTVQSKNSYVPAWNDGRDDNLDHHKMKACTNKNCLDGCSDEIITSSSSESKAIEGLISNQSYTICIQAVDKSGNKSNWIASKADLIILDSLRPDPPTNISPVNAYSSIVNSYKPDWTESTDIYTKYHQMKACKNKACNSDCLSIVEPAISNSSTLSGFEINTPYYICVQAIDQFDNQSDWMSSNGTVVILDSSTPDAPTNVSPGVNFSSITNSYTPTWNNSTDPFTKQHLLTACTNNTCDSGCLPSINPAVSGSSELSGFNLNTPYYVCVQALDQYGNSSNWVASSGTVAILDSATPDSPINVSPAVDYFSITNSYSPTWGNSPDVFTDHYVVKACTNNTCDSGCLPSVNPATSGLSVLTGFNLNTLYYICTQAVDEYGNVSNWVASNGTVAILDSLTPEAPTNVTPATNYSSATNSYTPTWNNSLDVFSDHHLITACTNNTCDSGCLTPIDPAVSGSSTLTGFNLNTSYYICAQTLDRYGNNSMWTSSAGTIAILDSMIPDAPTNISPATNYFSATNTYTPTWTNSIDPLFDHHQLKACTNNTCDSGCLSSVSPAFSGSSALTGFSLNTPYYVCTRAEDQYANLSGWVASPGTVVILDSLTPDSPTNVSPTSPVISNNNNYTPTWTDSTDPFADSHSIMACTNNTCDTGCLTSVGNAVSGVSSLTGFVVDTPYYICTKALDVYGNNSDWTASSSTFTFDALPTITNVIGPTGGLYAIGATLLFNIEFSESVNVTGSPQITLDIGGIIKNAVYQSGSGSNTLSFAYQIESGLTDADGISDPNSGYLDLNGGTIKDIGGFDLSSLAYVNFDPSNLTVDSVSLELLGSSSADSLYGGINNDTLIGGYDGDILEGGAGNDVIFPDGKNYNIASLPNIAYWVDGQDINGNGSTVFSGSSVATWTDKSGNNFNFTAPCANPPTYDESRFINNRSALYFNSSGNFLENTNIDIRPGSNPDITSIMIYNWIGSRSEILVGAGNNFTKRIHQKYGTTNTPYISILESSYTGSGDTYTRNQWSNGDQPYVGSFSTFSGTNVGVGIGQMLYSWTGYCGAYAVHASYGELILLYGTLTNTQRVDLEEHLSMKWGISLSGKQFGIDTLTGGTGADIFTWTNSSYSGVGSGNRDIVTDFKTSDNDKIDISQLIPGSFTVLGNTASFTSSGNPELRWNGSNPAVVYIDFTGNGSSDFEIELQGVSASSITSGDFILP